MKNLDEILKNVGPQCHAILWISEETFSDSLPFFSELDYLFDGLLGLQAKHENNSEHGHGPFHYFSSKNFGNPLSLGHISSKNKNWKNCVIQFNQLQINKNELDECVLVILPKNSSIAKEFKEVIKKSAIKKMFKYFSPHSHDSIKSAV